MLERLRSSLDSADGAWVVQSILSAMMHYDLCEQQERDLRIPQILAEPEFISRLGTGEALRALQTISFLIRFNRIIEEAAEEVLSGKF